MRLRFWCEPCRAWTTPEPVDEHTSSVRCTKCGEHYGCGECGFDIDPDGNCLRFETLGQDGLRDDGTPCPETKKEA